MLSTSIQAFFDEKTWTVSYVKMRTARDALLEVPTLILASIQVNIRAGRLPPAEDDGVSYLKIPLNALGKPKAGEGKKT